MIHIMLLFLSFKAFATALEPNLPSEGVMRGNSPFLDPTVDYSVFSGRVSDKSKDLVLLKIQVENTNSKFFEKGDQLSFYINEQSPSRVCQAEIEATEPFYFTIKNFELSDCWDTEKMFRRGTILHFHSPILTQRVQKAAQMRQQLIEQRQGLMKDLKSQGVNLVSLEEYKEQTYQEYERKIQELRKKQKQLPLEHYQQQKNETMAQLKLRQRLAEIDEALDHYRIDPTEVIKDRFLMDHDSSAPVEQPGL